MVSSVKSRPPRDGAEGILLAVELFGNVSLGVKSGSLVDVTFLEGMPLRSLLNEGDEKIRITMSQRKILKDLGLKTKPSGIPAKMSGSVDLRSPIHM